MDIYPRGKNQIQLVYNLFMAITTMMAAHQIPSRVPWIGASLGPWLFWLTAWGWTAFFLWDLYIVHWIEQKRGRLPEGEDTGQMLHERMIEHFSSKGFAERQGRALQKALVRMEQMEQKIKDLEDKEGEEDGS